MKRSLFCKAFRSFCFKRNFSGFLLNQKMWYWKFFEHSDSSEVYVFIIFGDNVIIDITHYKEGNT